jgi:hypothetical protein
VDAPYALGAASQQQPTPSTSYPNGTGMQSLLANVTPSAATQAFARHPGAGINSKLKAKIWANEYVEFASLLSSAASNNTTTWQISLAADGQRHDQAVVLNKPKAKPLTFMQWLTAFSTFSAVVAEKDPKEAADLWAYLQIIQEMYVKFQHTNAWHSYDEEFRRQRAITPHLHPWAIINWYYYNTALTTLWQNQNQTPKEPKRPNHAAMLTTTLEPVLKQCVTFYTSVLDAEATMLVSIAPKESPHQQARTGPFASGVAMATNKQNPACTGKPAAR